MTWALVAISLALLLFNVISARDHARDRARLIHALLSRGPADFAALERILEPRQPLMSRLRKRDENGEATEDMSPIGLGG